MFGRSKKTVASITYLAEGSDFQGNLRVQGGLRVDGLVRGTVEVNGDLEVSASGGIEGPEVKAGNIIVHGSIKASIVAEGSLTLTRTSRLEGDVVASALNIEAGAFYVGHIVTKDANLLPVAPPMPKLVGRSE
ncbi:MAG: polymer-forming cytoskeletal protein [Oscillatoriales cyanobacterium]|nr:MAG: polymer-forming cytoskeletal protein [Oscillatoriales cyanobacterium]